MILVPWDKDSWLGAIAGEVGLLELFGGEEGHLEVDGDEALGGLDEVVGLGVDDDDSVAGAVESEVRVGDSTKTFLGEKVVDGFGGDGSGLLIPLLGDDEGGLAGWLADDHACLLYTSPSPRDQRGSRMPSSA